MRGAEELLGPLRARDHLAFEALVERRYEALRRYLARLVGDGEIAADLTQETFLRAYQALPRLGDDSNVGSWLYRIATNLARQHHRHRRLVCWSRLETHQNALPGRSLEEEVATRDRVRRALEGLPLDQRVCLLLYAGTGYTCAEIGGILGRSAPAVRMLLLRARRRFRAAYGEPGGEPYGERGGAPPLDTGADGFRLPPAAPARGTGAVGAVGAVGAAGLAGEGGGAGSEGEGAGMAHGPEVEVGGGSGEAGRDCRPIEEALPFYPRGDLARGDFSAVSRHLARCRSCRLALLEVQASYRLLQRHLCTASTGEPGAARVALMARLRARAGALVLPPEATAPEAVLLPVPIVRRPGPGTPGGGSVDGRP
ncbi:MAG TPA: RNA polymerase sigma factor [Chloroflexota bacterium]|nr:RNA polymerase sigma factor [Chloroflexota bacterium]